MQEVEEQEVEELNNSEDRQRSLQPTEIKSLQVTEVKNFQEKLPYQEQQECNDQNENEGLIFKNQNGLGMISEEADEVESE